MKTYDRVCPYCRHMNRKLYLEETGGLMECEKCGQISYALIPQASEIYDMKTRSIKKKRDYARKSSDDLEPVVDVSKPVEMI